MSNHNDTVHDIEGLKKELRKNGFDYKLVERTDKKCIYSQHIGDLIVAYEVFKIKIRKTADKVRLAAKNGKKIDISNLPEFYEVFPSDEDFGKIAWTFRTLEKAKECYNGLS